MWKNARKKNIKKKSIVNITKKVYLLSIFREKEKNVSKKFSNSTSCLSSMLNERMSMLFLWYILCSCDSKNRNPQWRTKRHKVKANASQYDLVHVSPIWKWLQKNKVNMNIGVSDSIWRFFSHAKSECRLNQFCVCVLRLINLQNQLANGRILFCFYETTSTKKKQPLISNALQFRVCFSYFRQQKCLTWVFWAIREY